MEDLNRVKKERIRQLNNLPLKSGPIVYWMQRDQRVQDNWALLFAQDLARKNKVPLLVVFCLAPKFLGATRRQYDFMLRGLQEVEKDLQAKQIGFTVLCGDVENELPQFCKKNKIGAVVTDFNPLKLAQEWRRKVSKKIDCVGYEVDAHNIVPCWIASPKQEYGAYTLRPKINRLLPNFLEDFPQITTHKFQIEHKFTAVNWKKIQSQLSVDESVLPVTWLQPGAQAAHKQMKKFLQQLLPEYAEARNNPLAEGQSNLSPYFHFGQLAPARVALEVQKISKKTTAQKIKNSSAAFLEELIVRRELSDNFCFYNSNYDSVAGFPAWAQTSLASHLADTREYVYSLKKFDQATTHDELWNAAQRELLQTGKMAGYLRMYWAKKILEWTASPDEAIKIAIYLNDRYELDGRDPNGYAGIAWSIGGVHDRAWFNRPVYGSIRYMNAAGCAKKFPVKEYIKRYAS